MQLNSLDKTAKAVDFGARIPHVFGTWTLWVANGPCNTHISQGQGDRKFRKFTYYLCKPLSGVSTMAHVWSVGDT